MSDISSSPEPDRVSTQTSAEAEHNDVLTISQYRGAQGPSVPAAVLKGHATGDREAVSGNHSVCQAV